MNGVARDAKLKALQGQVNIPDRQITAKHQAQQQALADLTRRKRSWVRRWQIP